MIKAQPVYHPLYTCKDKSIFLVTGGRGSGKSFNVSTFIERLTFELGHTVLFTRYTMSSAKDSVIPEFIEKAELDNTTDYFDILKSDVTNLVSGTKVMFRGIKTSSGNQTAKLKSIQGLTTFVCDEAEEWTSEKEFETLVLSIRVKGVQNRTIIIMNPTDDNHFIYQKYIKNTHKLVEYDGVPVQISTHPDVLHIHTTYLDNIENLSKEFLSNINRLKLKNPDKYAHTVIGRWADVAEGVIFKVNVVKEYPSWVKKEGIGLDFGYTNDPTAAVRCGIVDNALYMDELFYETGMLTSSIAKKLHPYPYKVIADSADPRLIDEIKLRGVKIYDVAKGPGSVIAGIEKMKDMELYVTERSYNLLQEFRKYTWAKDKNGNFINQPIDDYNHLIDAVRYYVLWFILGRRTTKQRALGI